MSNTLLFKKMSKIVEKRVQRFKDDFYIEDKKLLRDPEDNEYVWIARTCGTLLCPMKKLNRFVKYYNFYDSFGEDAGYYLLNLEKQTITKIMDRKKFLKEHLEETAA